MKSGHFIVIEGLDGAGTTTQAKMLADRLMDRGHRAQMTAQPSDGPIGRFIRNVLRGKELGTDGKTMSPDAIAGLFVADRVDHLNSVINPALNAGAVVICDRYVHSSLAYQGVDCDIDWVARMNAPMPSPDLTILVEVSAELAAQRRTERAEESELYEVNAFQRKVARGYHRAIELRPSDHVVTIDGSLSIDEVHSAICSAVSECLDMSL